MSERTITLDVASEAHARGVVELLDWTTEDSSMKARYNSDLHLLTIRTGLGADAAAAFFDSDVTIDELARCLVDIVDLAELAAWFEAARGNDVDSLLLATLFFHYNYASGVRLTEAQLEERQRSTLEYMFD